MGVRGAKAAVAALAVAAVAAGVVPAGPAHAAGPADRAGACARLSDQLDWYGDNREQLQRTIDRLGLCGRQPVSGVPGGGSAGGRPVAAFDWDNTMVKNDTTDATLVWALQHDEILRPERWSDLSPWLTGSAAKALIRACGTGVPAGEPLPTSRDADCADEILEIRLEGATMDGEPAFGGEWNHRRTVPEYAWAGQLFTGHTPAEVSRIAQQARHRALARPEGAQDRVGTHTVPGWIRYYPQMRDLAGVLERSGFEVWVVSAGVAPITEVWAAGAGVPADRTVAIRSELDGGRITPRNEGCGGADGGRGEVIPYIDGKRCFVNQEIFGVDGPAAWERQAPQQRIAIGGGDADTDVSFVADATGAHLVLNRNKDEIMCRAYDNEDGNWLVNPMFIDPLPQREPYRCATSGASSPGGGREPLLREDGSPVPDQEDRVHG